MSLWVSNGESEDLFWRSAMSGGRATVGFRKGKTHTRHAGDISATSKEGHALTDEWYVECKAYKNLQISSAMIKGVGKLVQFWETAMLEAERYGKKPMLIVKQNQVPVIVLIPIYHTTQKSHLGTFTRMGCDVLDFRGMLKGRFVGRAARRPRARTRERL